PALRSAPATPPGAQPKTSAILSARPRAATSAHTRPEPRRRLDLGPDLGPGQARAAQAEEAPPRRGAWAGSSASPRTVPYAVSAIADPPPGAGRWLAPADPASSPPTPADPL